MRRTLLVFRRKIPLEDAIGSQAGTLETSMSVTQWYSSWVVILLPVDSVNSVQTLKAMVKNETIRNAVDVVGSHYPIQVRACSRIHFVYG
jgi:hypothetical protein